MKYSYKKRFGQNFLVDHGVIANIVNVFAPQSTDYILEIGPGRGALTKAIVPRVERADLVELDRDLIKPLQEQCNRYPHCTVHQGDILQFKLSQISHANQLIRVIGNLPYNITTPLLFHCFSQIALIQDMHFMVQKEVAMRLCAQPGEKAYGRLSIMAQLYCTSEILLTVCPNAFMPPPQVDSSVVRLIPRTVDSPLLQVENHEQLHKIVSQAFTYRRKTLSNALKGLVKVAELELLELAPCLRPEDLSVENYVRLSNFLSQKNKRL